MNTFFLSAKRTIFCLSLFSLLASIGSARGDFDPTSLDVSNYIEEFMHLSSQLTGATRSNAYIVLSKPMCHFIQNCFHFLKDNAEEMSANLEACHTTLDQGTSQLKIKDLRSIIPDLSKCLLLWSSRALRPTLINVVGANGCDLGPVLALLQNLQCSIDNLDCNEIIETFSLEFIETFSLLQEITNTITACCNDLSLTITADFIATWTILNEINTTLTTCCNDLSVTITADFIATWTILNEITNTVTACCNDLSVTITADFIATWTILNEINTTLTTCCNDLLVTITADFIATWTILDEINTTLTSCCSLIETLTQACGSTPITSALTITEPGTYCLNDFITGVITIASDDVALNLNNYRISGGTNGIVIDPNFSRITVYNGDIGDTTDNAILVGSGTRDITLKNLRITNAGSGANPAAISFQGTVLAPVIAGQIINVIIDNCQSGIEVLSSGGFLIIDCTIQNITSAGLVHGILIDGLGGLSTDNQIVGCTINALTSEGTSATGITLAAAINSIIENCVITNVLGANDARGINNSSANNSFINNCTMSNIFNTANGFTTHGLQIILSEKVVAQNLIIRELGDSLATPARIAGVSISNSLNATLQDVIIKQLKGAATTSAGIEIVDVSHDALIKNCLIQDITPDNTVVLGVRIGGGGSNNVTCIDCIVADLQATTSVIGYSVNTDDVISNISLLRCQANNLLCDQAARGFLLDNVGGGYLLECNAQELITTTTADGIGYDILTTATFIVLDSCTAQKIYLAFDPQLFTPEGIGFSIAGKFITLQKCLATITGVGFYTAPVAISAFNECTSMATFFGFALDGPTGNNEVFNSNAILSTFGVIGVGVDPAVWLAAGAAAVVGQNLNS